MVLTHDEANTSSLLDTLMLSKLLNVNIIVNVLMTCAL